MTSLSHLASTVGAMEPLTDQQLQILAFERQWWKYAGAKESAIRDAFGWSATRYYQALRMIVDLPAALVHDPMLVKRLRRLRDTREHRRRRPPVGRRLG